MLLFWNIYIFCSKSIDILKNEGANILVAQLPDKHDPDEIIKQQGKDAMTEIISKALPPTDFLLLHELKKYDLNLPDEKSKFINSAIEIISKLSSNSEKDVYLEKLRDITTVPIDILRRDVESLNKNNKNNLQNESENVLVTRENGNIRAIRYILGCLIFKKPFVNKMIDYKKLMPKQADVIDCATKGIPISSYFDYFDVDNYPLLKDCLGLDFSEFKDNDKKYFDECVWLLASAELIKKQNDLAEEFKNTVDKEKRKEIAEKLNLLNKELREKNLEEFYDRNQD